MDFFRNSPETSARKTRLMQLPKRRLLVTAIQAALMGALPTMAWAQTSEEPVQANAVRSLQQVEVTAESEASHRKPGANTTVDGDQLERANSLEDVVRYQPLVSAPGVATGASRNKSSFDRSGTTGYNIRGVEGNRIGMDIDGVEMPSATTRPYVSRVGVNTFGVGRDFMDPEMYGSAEIESGTTAARRNAGGIGGAVGFRSKSPELYLTGDTSSYFSGKTGYDSADRSWNESITAAGRAGQYDGLIAYSRRDGHASSNNSSTVESAPNDWNSNALLLKGGVQVDAENHLSLSADMYRRKNQSQFDGWNTAKTAITERSAQDSSTGRSTLQLSHQWTPSNAFADRVDTRLYLQDTSTNDVTDTTTLSNGSTVRNVSGTQTQGWGLSTTADKRIGSHKLSAGLNASIEESERPWTVSGYMKPQPDTTTYRQGVFVQDEITFSAGGKRLAFTPALRLDRVETQSRNLQDFVSGALTLADATRIYGSPSVNTIASPSLSLVYDLTPEFSAYAQYKRGGRAASAGEVFGSWNMNASYSATQYALIGNRDLKAETSDTVDIGLKGSPTKGVKLNTSVFYTKYKDFIAYTRYTRAANPSMFTNVPSNLSIIYQAENRDEASIYGFDISTRLEHGVWSPGLQGLYSTWALGVSKGTSKSYYLGDTDVDLDSVPPAKAVIGVGFDAPQKAWGLNLTGTFVAAKQAVATNREAYSSGGSLNTATVLFNVPGYSVFDLSGYWQINKTWRMNAGINNLTDRRYWDYASARNLQPSVAADQRDLELLTNTGRSYAVSLVATF
nr:TonB-dependent hemoglobin/transferrin/lactoferrin family receptor [uncultured Rhodoferax sp.]